jgi:SAM-dependent methyltransferase
MALSRIVSMKQDWELLGKVNPFWAVAGPPSAGAASWDIESLLESGKKEISGVMAIAHELGYPNQRALAFDFGCGVGRLTRPLASYFERVIGYDISENMILQARAINSDSLGCEFVVGDGELGGYQAGEFDFVFSSGTLQVLPDQGTILAYVAEMLRILRPAGLLVFQVPSYVALLYRAQLRRKAYLLLRRLGMAEETIYERFDCYPQFVTAVPVRHMRGFLPSRGARILRVLRYGPHNGRMYFVTK